VLLDTQWWLHGGPKPTDPNSDCPEDAESEVVDSLHAAVAGAGERLVVVAGSRMVVMADLPAHLRTNVVDLENATLDLLGQCFSQPFDPLQHVRLAGRQILWS
jgi:hypothetical protein